MKADAETLYGMIVEFEDVPLLMTAVSKCRDFGFTKWDVHTPFPLHGMDRAMGIKPTRLPYLVLGGGLMGLAAGTAMQLWMNAIDYPLNISGKPLFGIPANIPVMFELTVLVSALTVFFGMWSMNGLPRLYHPLFKSRRFRRATQDRFFIVIEAVDPKFELEETRKFLASLGGNVIEEVTENPED
ncbi:MAG: DUF3341 domain-containing protein [bacterium]|nr:DUF3341 domain-containing protein [bacterium]